MDLRALIGSRKLGLFTRGPARAEGLECCDGGGEGQNRTADTAIFSRVLYQLSYLAQAWQDSNRAAGCGARRATLGIASVSLDLPCPSGAARSAHLPVKEKAAGSNPVWGAPVSSESSAVPGAGLERNGLRRGPIV